MQMPGAASLRSHGSQANRPPTSPKLRSHLRVLGLAGMLVVGVFFTIGLYVRIFSSQNVADRDYIEYWAQGQLLAQRANPFNPSAILQIQQAAGLQDDSARISFSPPIALWFTMPLGYVSASSGMRWWLIAQLACLSVSLWLLWILNGRPAFRWHLFGYLFAPVIACEMAGQLGIFFLLCLVLFLLLHKTYPSLAGAALTPFALKPHLVLPFALVLLVWIVFRRAYSVFAGAAVALTVSCTLSLYLDSRAWSQYRHMMEVSGVMQAFVPAIPVALRFVLDRSARWIQFSPELSACVWALWYFWRHRDRWNWGDHGLVVLLVASICTPYGWFFDESILLPAVLAGLYCALQSRRSIVPLALIAAVALAEIFAGVKLNTPYYLWTPLAWLGWYLYATKKKKTGEAESTASPA